MAALLCAASRDIGGGVIYDTEMTGARSVPPRRQLLVEFEGGCFRMTNEGRATENAAGRPDTLTTVVATLEALVQDWDVEEPIGLETRVVADLGFESVDLIQMIAALEQAFRPPRISLVDLLVADGRYVDDLTVGQIVDGVSARLGAGTGR
jgi:acyl carrier protein